MRKKRKRKERKERKGRGGGMEGKRKRERDRYFQLHRVSMRGIEDNLSNNRYQQAATGKGVASG